MLRFLGFTIICFLLPFMAYGGWRYFRAGVTPGSEAWPSQVWMRLAGVGVVAMLVAIAISISFTEGSVGQVYHPARIENGQLIPGGFQ
jgi:hypothetical protein